MRATRSKRIRVLLADDHRAMLDTIAQTLAAKFDVVGAVSDGGAALAAAESLEPDVIVLDISMPVMSGLDAAKRLQERGCHAAVVILTIHDDRELLNAAFVAGARGYVAKSQMRSDLSAAIRQAHAGGYFISASLCRKHADQ
jgi:DNA-binding NarL/FixJ family response regulator